MLYILLSVILFGVLIILHELGHFLTAKLCGIEVTEFALGMGPTLWKKQKGETLYALHLLPLGGFCAMNEEEGSPRSFQSRSGLQKFLVLAAGSVMNFVTGFLILVVIFQSAVAFYTPVITGFMEGSTLEADGLRVGDEITKIDGERVYIYNDLSLLFSRSNGKTMDLEIRRDGKTMALDDFPMVLREFEEEGETVLRYGLYFGSEPANFGTKLKNAWLNSLDFVRLVRMSIVDLASGRAGISDLSGPVGIVGTISEVGDSASSTSEALGDIFYFMALIAVNLAVMNLLPLPALDGGRIFFLLLNGVVFLVSRRKIPEKYEEYVHAAGLICLLGIMVLVTAGDVLKLVRG